MNGMHEVTITAGHSSKAIQDCAILIGKLAEFKCPYSEGGTELSTKELGELCKYAELAQASINKLTGALNNMRVDSIHRSSFGERLCNGK